jgi:hypothetical protein
MWLIANCLEPSPLCVHVTRRRRKNPAEIERSAMHKYLSRFLAILTAATFLYIVGGFVYLFVPLGPWISPWCTHDLLA